MWGGENDEPDTSVEDLDALPVPNLDPNVTPSNMEDPDGVYRAYVGRLNEQRAAINAYLANNQNENLSRKVKEIETALKELKKMGEKTDVEFKLERLTGNDLGGYTEYNPTTGKIVIAVPREENFPDFNQAGQSRLLGIEAHEFKHGYQYIRGRISFNRTTGNAGVLYDLKDEVEAYERQYIITSGRFYGSVTWDDTSFPAGNYSITNAVVLGIGNTMTPPAYQNLPTTQITIFTKPQGRQLQIDAQNNVATDVFIKP